MKVFIKNKLRYMFINHILKLCKFAIRMHICIKAIKISFVAVFPDFAKGYQHHIAFIIFVLNYNFLRYFL